MPRFRLFGRRHEPIVCTGWQVNVAIIGILRAFLLGADKKPETNF